MYVFLHVPVCSNQLSMQLRQQCLHRWRKIVFSEDQILEEFTPQIRRDIVTYVNKDSLTKISFLNDLLAEAQRPDQPDLLPLAKVLI